FFAALRLLENVHIDKPRIGQSIRPQDDAVRFGQTPSVAFEPGMLSSFIPGSDGRPPHLNVNFLGLLGANGPMPIHITEYVRDRMRNSADPTLARFLDIFHHRMISLFYRAWASAQPTVSLDRPDTDRFSEYIASLIGTGMESLRKRDALPDFAKLHYAGRLSSLTHNAEGLAKTLADFFKLPVQIQEFVGHWMMLPVDSRCRLRTGHDAEVLGMTTVLGSQVWNCQHKFRVVIGPIDLAEFRRMLPGGESLQRLTAWIRNYVGLTYNWDVNLILKQKEIPPLKLGKQAQLGWTTWLGSRPPKNDDRQLLLCPSSHVS
ncbi:MAG TPA: type VI secretion system baseplate subunit TssG, partial [Burkholderiaceae bacterium]|nr:type VI secretion system baseplate subunit TssG [Burkholderiaceae bacterium]